MQTLIRECRTPHHGACEVVLHLDTVLATLEQHGFEARLASPTTVEAWEPSITFSFTGGPPVDSSAWVTVPTTAHALAVWLGY